MLLLLVIVLASAGVRRPATRRPVAPRTSPAVSRVASSTLSRQVAVAVTPDLEAEFRDVGVTFGGPLYIRAFKYDTAKAALLFESLSGAKGPVAQRNTENRNMNSQYYSGSSIEIWAKRTDSEVFELFKSYPVCMYSGKLGPKQREGDMMTPEGIYDVVPSSFNPFSSYRLSFNVGYPNQYDKLKRRTGGSVMVHGICGSVGCFAMVTTFLFSSSSSLFSPLFSLRFSSHSSLQGRSD